MTHTLPADLVSYLLIGASAFLVVHWLRRAILKPIGPSTTDPNAGRTTIFDRFQRLFHWTSLVALSVVIGSGLALYYPAVLEPAAMAVGFPLHTNFRLLVDVHVAGVVAFALLMAGHIGWDVFKVRGSRLVIPSKNDLRQLVSRAESFVSGGDTAKSGKYDVFMKSFHILLTVSSIILAVSGVTLYFFAPWWLVPQLSHQAIEPWWKPTILHDLFGFALITLLVAHTYFAMLRVNRPLLRAMISPRPPLRETESEKQ
jgi:cytochrome b subunit of formate dehydrogenase